MGTFFLCYDKVGGNMENMIGDNFEKSNKYRLYRRVEKIIHPTISKKNISSYKIVIDEGLLPIRVFYPKKVSNINSFILYLPGDGNVTGCVGEYSRICQDISMECNKLVIAIDYFEEKIQFPETLEKCFQTVKYFINELIELGISKEKIILFGDSTGANILSAMHLKNNERLTEKQVLFYPVVSGEYFGKTQYESIIKNSEYDLLTVSRVKKYLENYICKESDLNSEFVCPIKAVDYKKFPRTLIITGDLDPLRDEGKDFYEKLWKVSKKNKYYNIKFSSHGFLVSKDEEIKNEVYGKVREFIK